MDDVVEPKVTVFPKDPVPICTLMSDGGLQVEHEQVPLLDLQRMLLSAAANITLRTVQRAARMEQVLASVQARFDGFDEATAQAMAVALDPRQAPPG